MIKAFILYFLSIKPTHGYEIQKYIQLNSMNDWTKIQSGSIYYALSKLEKSGLIELLREESIGRKVRKIYSITDLGKAELENLIMEEIKKPIHNVKSDKFVSYPFIVGIDKETIIKTVNQHIMELAQRKAEMLYWQSTKIDDRSLGIERISFEMIISSLDYQIKWHRALVDEIDKYIEQSEHIHNFIKRIDFAEVTDISSLYEQYKKDI